MVQSSPSRNSYSGMEKHLVAGSSVWGIYHFSSSLAKLAARLAVYQMLQRQAYGILERPGGF